MLPPQRVLAEWSWYPASPSDHRKEAPKEFVVAKDHVSDCLGFFADSRSVQVVLAEVSFVVSHLLLPPLVLICTA